MTITSQQRMRQRHVAEAQVEIQELSHAVIAHRRRACATDLLELELHKARSRLNALVAQGRLSARVSP